MTHTGVSDSPIIPDNSNSENSDLESLDLLYAANNAKSLASFIRTCETPMTIGIQGKWGTGKTSLMHLIDKEISDEKCIRVWLNTWQYAQIYDEKALPLWIIAGLSRKLWNETTALVQAKSMAKRAFEAVLRALDNQLGKGVLPEDLCESSDAKLDGSLVVETIHDNFSKYVTGLHDIDAAHRIVFFIDDLDRVPPRVAVSVLESLQNFVTGRHCVFVLAVDFEVVIKGLEERKNVDGRQFFDKIIQVPFHLPPYGDAALINYVNKHFAKVSGADGKDIPHLKLHEIARLTVDGNPRSIKRALNLYAILSQLAPSSLASGSSLTPAEMAVVFGLACLQVSAKCETLYKALLRTKSPYRLLNAVAHDDSFPDDVDSVEKEHLVNASQQVIDIAYSMLELIARGLPEDNTRETRLADLLTVSRATAVETDEQTGPSSKRISFDEMKELGFMDERSKLVLSHESYSGIKQRVYPEFDKKKHHRIRTAVQGGKSKKKTQLLSALTGDLVGTTTARQRYSEYWEVEHSGNKLSDIIAKCRQGRRADE